MNITEELLNKHLHDVLMGQDTDTQTTMVRLGLVTQEECDAGEFSDDSGNRELHDAIKRFALKAAMTVGDPTATGLFGFILGMSFADAHYQEREALTASVNATLDGLTITEEPR